MPRTTKLQRAVTPGVFLLMAGLMLAVSASVTTAANLIGNPGFESPVIPGGGPPEYYGAGSSWTPFGAVYTIGSVVAPPHAGNQSLKVFGGCCSGAFQQFPALPGQTWNGGVWMLNDSRDLMGGGQVAAVNIEWIRADGANSAIIPFISNGTFTAASPVDTWTLQTITGVAPADAVFARLVLITGDFLPGGPAGAPKFDDAFFELVPIPIGFDFTPNTLNLNSQGLWVTGFLEPPAPFAAGDIDVASIRLNGTVPVDPAAPTALNDHNGNGIADLMVKFNRLAVDLSLPEGDQVPVEVTGMVMGQPFAGTDYIRVRHAAVMAPVGGSHLTAGSVTQVRWETPRDVTVQSVALFHSTDGGNTWSKIAQGQPNTGSFDWAVPNIQTDLAKVAVVLVESADETGNIVEGVVGASEQFSIQSIVGVDDPGSVQFVLRAVTPNPARGALRVNFSLRDARAATLSLFDISGRQLAQRRVDGMGPGWHMVELGGSRLPAGLYMIRLTQGGRTLTTRAVAIQ